MPQKAHKTVIIEAISNDPKSKLCLGHPKLWKIEEKNICYSDTCQLRVCGWQKKLVNTKKSSNVDVLEKSMTIWRTSNKSPDLHDYHRYV